ncbi:hypothetical protein Amet_2422 [Alkaliphilus metalliredigens QYMF]|uniref:Phage XkdN-like protein n=1 Tax=Alkaliphilus metalliredigens (strain QYMF) TaxID=293826 RepID=A6TQV8_ALKMQ|nr:hypothetical protein [Alkaliphilus metalliredigens]ABR48576.1 hypothetical protein Amet_2422 [Alkaliphilus metalliredigens QYMF]
MAKKPVIKKLTLNDLMQQREKYEVKQDTKEEVLLRRGDDQVTITIKKPTRSLCLECITLSQDENRQEQADINMVYNIVVEPNLKDTNLHKAYGCIEPIEIVEKIFETGEIAQISGYGMELAGYGNEMKAIKDIKN